MGRNESNQTQKNGAYVIYQKQVLFVEGAKNCICKKKSSLESLHLISLLGYLFILA